MCVSFYDLKSLYLAALLFLPGHGAWWAGPRPRCLLVSSVRSLDSISVPGVRDDSVSGQSESGIRELCIE